MRQIYFDNNSTTPLEPETLQAMLPFLNGHFGNPSSSHSHGVLAAQAIDRARRQVADLVCAEAEQVIFCASATEAINWALHTCSGKIITSEVEHTATLEACSHLRSRDKQVTVLAVGSSGQLDLSELELHLVHDACTVALLWANNETGVIFPIADIAALCRSRGAYLHVDAVQAAGRLSIDFSALGIDSLVMSSHKLFGPKGAAALVVRDPDRIPPLLWGGGQERGRRGGTENVPAIVGFGIAADRALHSLAERASKASELRDRLETAILERVRGTWINGAGSMRLPNTCNVGFDGIDAQTLADILDGHGVAVSTGSACHAKSMEPSHVIRAMTRSHRKASESIRFSLSHLNTSEEVDYVADVVRSSAAALR